MFSLGVVYCLGCVDFVLISNEGVVVFTIYLI